LTAQLVPRGKEDSQPSPQLIYVDGAMVPHGEATIHVSSVAAKFGANAFEGLCAYAGEDGQSYVFRLREHLARLHRSVQAMEIDWDRSDEECQAAVLMSLRENGIRGDAHLRLSVFITGDGMCDTRGPASLVCVAKARKPAPLDTKVADAAVTSWRRIDDQVMPPRVKAGPNYFNSRYGLLEARRNGYDEAIFLTLTGKVSEGANCCFAMVRDGVLATPSVTSGVLESITRSTLLQLAEEDLGLRVQEREIDRSELYAADEAFFCGSAQEVRPVLSVDRFQVGDGRIGPVTRHLWAAYESAVRGRNEARRGWLTPVWPPVRR
jgi:branched-chain amino acid aminotransferase